MPSRLSYSVLPRGVINSFPPASCRQVASAPLGAPSAAPPQPGPQAWLACPRAPRPRRAARTRRHDDNQPTMLAFRRLLAFRRGHDQTQTQPRQVSQTHTSGPAAGLPLWPSGGRTHDMGPYQGNRHTHASALGPMSCGHQTFALRPASASHLGDGPGSASGRAAGGWGCGRMRGRCVAVGSCWASLRLLPAPLFLAPITCLSTTVCCLQVYHNS